MGTLIDCKKYASDLKLKLTEKVSLYNKNYNKRPKCLIILIGDNQASKAYIRGKVNDFGGIGIESQILKLDETVSQADAIRKIEEMLELFNPDGVILQLPVPKHINSDILSSLYKSNQDIDGFKPDSTFRPCTPLGIMNLLKENNIHIVGKHVVILGRSNIVGKPLADMMLESDATVTVCHSKTENLANITRQADILISAVGKRNLVTPDMIKDGVVLVDVGINRDENNKIKGDISEECYEKSDRYTIVPGGIGLVTRITLCENIVTSFELRRIQK